MSQHQGLAPRVSEQGHGAVLAEHHRLPHGGGGADTGARWGLGAQPGCQPGEGQVGVPALPQQCSECKILRAKYPRPGIKKISHEAAESCFR